MNDNKFIFESFEVPVGLISLVRIEMLLKQIYILRLRRAHGIFLYAIFFVFSQDFLFILLYSLSHSK